jgi:hypothetical protein
MRALYGVAALLMGIRARGLERIEGALLWPCYAGEGSMRSRGPAIGRCSSSSGLG